jgi:hypothetical protein
MALTQVQTGMLGTGAVLQVINASSTTFTVLTTSTFTDVGGLTATITPKFATSKILVMVNANGCAKDTGNTSLGLQLLRNSTVINNFVSTAGFTNSTATNRFGSCTTNYLDSPATTSAITYKVQAASTQNLANVYVNIDSTNSPSTITLVEIAG